MIVIIRKKWAAWMGLIIGVLLLLAIIQFVEYETVMTMNLPATTKVIIIDPGHGGIDPGAVGKDGTLEKDINLNIGLYLREYLEQSGAYVIMTREKDKGLYSEGSKNKKREDLEKRKEIVLNSNGDLFISIHLNSFSQSRYNGAQTFYPQDNLLGKELGQILQEELIKSLDKENNRVPLPRENIYILRDQILPSVLVECGFLSNPQELKKLRDKSYQKKIAWAIYVGIQRYFSEAS